MLDEFSVLALVTTRLEGAERLIAMFDAEFRDPSARRAQGDRGAAGAWTGRISRCGRGDWGWLARSRIAQRIRSVE
ncbi:MAG: hypothetical protein K2Y23_06355 [Cyanobacteria bacterium]|nr:hypothetical protein [Cyanobacteriota bacterium]